MRDIITELSLAGIVPAIQVDRAEDAVPLCEALAAGGLPVAEFTFRTAAAAEAIRRVHEELPDILLGAGTVIDTEQVDRAIAAGARYIVSPGLNPRVVKHCQDKGIPVIPGCATPSDIEQALGLGLKLVKFFPAEPLGGLKMIKALAGPYREMRYLPTGGVNESNLLSYLAFDHVAACGGSWMVPKDAVAAGDWQRVTALTRAAVDLLLGFELLHVGINSPDRAAGERDARRLAAIFGMPVREGEKAYFTGKAFEVMKAPGRGEKGHIGIACNSVDRAVWHLERRGLSFDRGSVRMQGEQMEFIYMDEAIGGFAIHLTKEQ